MANRKAAYGQDKGKVLKKGEYSKKDGRYAYRYTDLFQNVKFIYAQTLTELRKEEKEIEKAQILRVNRTNENMTVEELYDIYLQTRNYRRSTMKNMNSYRSMLRKHPIFFMKIGQVNTSTVLLFAKWLSDNYSVATAKKLGGIVSNCFQLAVQDEKIFKNPFDCDWRKRLPKTKRKSPKSLTDEEFDKIIDFMAHNNRYRYYIPHFFFLRETGLRISEFCALTVDDVDVENRDLRVNKQVLIPGARADGYIEVTKTPQSEAVIPLSPKALFYIQDLIHRCREPFSYGGMDGFFITLRFREGITSSTDWDKLFKRIETAYNRDHPEQFIFLTPHTLRHTFVTRSIRNGISPASVSIMARHANLATTLSVYMHPEMEDAKKELDDIYGTKPGLDLTKI